MSRFFSSKYSRLVPYIPGEQPKNREYIKLNTNESPFSPSFAVLEAVKKEVAGLNLYSDPEASYLVDKCAELYNVKRQNVIMTNGSDEALNFAFMAFCDTMHPIVFPNITYGFYKVFAELNNIPYSEIPLADDFSVDYRDYVGIGKNIVIANPNAPTGIFLPLEQIEAIVKSNPDNIVIVDEAYVDFGGESAVPLTEKYENLIVTQTFSKSRSLAGARLGFAIANESLIRDMNTIKYSTNPYNVNRMTMAAGYAAFCDNEYYMSNCATIAAVREKTALSLKDIGFEVLPSQANFIFAKSEKISGVKLYSELKSRGVLVRHFDKPGIEEYNRITIGTEEQMTVFIDTVKEILREN